MAKSFKLRVTKMITTTFQSCRSKDPSTLPQDPVPSSYFQFSSFNPTLEPVDHFSLATTQPSSKPQHQYRSTFRRQVSSAFLSVGRGFTLKPGVPKNSVDDRCRASHEFKWQQEENWHVVAKVYEESQTPRRKIYNSSASGESEDEISALPPLPLPPPATGRKNRRGKKKKIPTRLRMSTSSGESGLFSNEEEESLETETLVSSSRSFSTDSSSEFNPHLETIREKTTISRRSQKRNKKKAKRKCSVSKTIYRVSSVSENDSPARLSVFKKLIPCTVDGKVKESFAVIKKSEDPYEDFKRSMMEMILEKQMFEENDLEQLLQCFLSLNSRDYHGLIIQVFVEIWEAMFCASDRSFSRPLAPVNSRNSFAVRATKQLQLSMV